jgi:hypothetical protein
VRRPKTSVEWQEAVDAAHGALALDSARAFGLVKGGPTVNVDRCDKILADGRARGFLPRPNSVEEFVHGLAKHFPR